MKDAPDWDVSVFEQLNGELETECIATKQPEPSDASRKKEVRKE